MTCYIRAVGSLKKRKHVICYCSTAHNSLQILYCVNFDALYPPEFRNRGEIKSYKILPVVQIFTYIEEHAKCFIQGDVTSCDQ